MTTSHLLVVHHKDPGQVRDYQEDDYGDYKIRDGEYRLLVVADGMGGHSHGDVASRMAIEALAQFVEYGAWDEPARALRQGFAIANERVHRQGIDMGTTLTAILFHEATSQYWWANVGDSRAYLLEGTTLHQLSRDHSEIQVRVDAGQLTTEDARLSKGRNVLLRAIGPSERVEADVEGPYELVPGQRLMLCSDGLHGMLSEPELAAITGHELQEVAKNLVAAANAAGGKDNIAALVAALSAGEATVFMGATPAVAAKPASPLAKLAGVGRMGRVAAIPMAAAAFGVLGLGVAAVLWAANDGGGTSLSAAEQTATPAALASQTRTPTRTATTPSPTTTPATPVPATDTPAPTPPDSTPVPPTPTLTPTKAATVTPTQPPSATPTSTPTATATSAPTSSATATPTSTPSPPATSVPIPLVANKPERPNETTITFTWLYPAQAAAFNLQIWPRGTSDQSPVPGLTGRTHSIAITPGAMPYCFSVTAFVDGVQVDSKQACE